MSPERVSEQEMMPSPDFPGYTYFRKPLGRGGTGRVYKCRSPAGETVAIKTRKPYLDADEQRAREEIGRAASIKHPNMLRFFEILKNEDTLALGVAMEFVEGENLDQRLRQLPGNRLSPREATSITRTISDLLSSAHAAKVLHRDIKPANIIIPNGDPRMARLVDWTDSKIVPPEGTGATTGDARGTRNYIAPERLNGKSATEQSDIYSLGAVLYRIVKGDEPRFMQDLPRLPKAHSVPRALVRIIARCVEPDPADRYRSAKDLRDALDAFLRPRRSPGTVFLVAAMLLLGVVISATTLRSAFETPPTPTPPGERIAQREPDPPDAARAPAARDAAPRTPPPQPPAPDPASTQQLQMTLSPNEESIVRALFAEAGSAERDELWRQFLAGFEQGVRLGVRDELQRQLQVAQAAVRQAQDAILAAGTLMPENEGQRRQNEDTLRQWRAASATRTAEVQRLEAAIRALDPLLAPAPTQTQRAVPPPSASTAAPEPSASTAAPETETSPSPRDGGMLLGRIERNGSTWSGAPEQRRYVSESGDPISFRNSFGIFFAVLPSGTFTVGSPASEPGRGDNEVQREVAVESVYMGLTEVTNAQFRMFRPSHDSGEFDGHDLNNDDCPVVRVTWDDASAFCAWLGRQEGDPTHYRLPTEVEWEAACRAGTSGTWFWGDNQQRAGRFANVADRAAGARWAEWEAFDVDDGYSATAPVGSFEPNAFGFFDMIGNVAEWCSGELGLERGIVVGLVLSHARPLRGGSWRSSAQFCRAARRGHARHDFADDYISFRVVAVRAPR